MTNTELREIADEFIGSVPGTRPGELLSSMMRNVDELNDLGKAILNLIEENEKLKKDHRSLPLAILQCPKCLIPINRRNGEVFL